MLDVIAEYIQETKDEANVSLATTGIDIGLGFNARLLQAARLTTYSDAELDLVYARTSDDVLGGYYPADEKDYMQLAVWHVYLTLVLPSKPAQGSTMNYLVTFQYFSCSLTFPTSNFNQIRNNRELFVEKPLCW